MCRLSVKYYDACVKYHDFSVKYDDFNVEYHDFSVKYYDFRVKFADFRVKCGEPVFLLFKFYFSSSRFMICLLKKSSVTYILCSRAYFH